MAKRPFNQANVDGQDRRPGADRKRFKKDESAPSSKAPDEITSIRQLQALFADYSNAAKIQSGIQSFKRFLAECRDLQYALHLNEEVKLCLLQEYLTSQTSKDGDEICNDLMQAWSFASQSNNYTLLSSVPTALHLLLRTISLFPTWKPHGVTLSKTVLQPPYIKLIYRSLGGSKDAISSPCLRLLTEINKFDNGSQCSLLHQSLDFTVKDLTRNLDAKKSEKADTVAVEDPDRPSVRTTYVRFILSFFQYGTPRIKTDIMGLRNFTTPLFKHIRQDSAVLIDEVLKTFETSLLSDGEISRGSKTNYFNDWSLSRLAELCYRTDTMEEDTTVADITLRFLEKACGDTGNGVCFKQNGWYGNKPDPSSTVKTGKDTVNNRILLGLIKTLRPHSNTYHLRLLISIFTASPELVAAYFGDTTSLLSFEPKLTATWIGLSSVMLESILLPIPRNFGYNGGTGEGAPHPPPVKNMVENMLPQSVNRTVLTKCFTFNNPFVRFLGVRILNAAFGKLEGALQLLDTMGGEMVDKSKWEEASYDLVDEFVKRAPEASVVVTLFNQVAGSGGELMREGVGRLMGNYWEILPASSITTSTSSAGGSGKGGFDFGPVFAKVLGKIGDVKGMEKLEVGHTLRLARVLADTKWWGKGSAAQYSPAVTLMGVLVQQKGGREVYELVEKIVHDSPLFGKEEGYYHLEALLESLEYIYKYTEGGKVWDRVLTYLDNACGRLVQSPFKFYDIVGEAMERIGGGIGVLSPLIAVLFHQFNYVKEGDVEEGLCRWLFRLASNFWVIGEMKMEVEDINTDGANEVFVQFVQGVQSWKRRLGEFKIWREYSSTDITGFPLDFSLPSLTISPTEIREEYLIPLKSTIPAVSAPVSIFCWRRIQSTVEILMRILQTVDEIQYLGLSERKFWGEIANSIYDTYESSAKGILENAAYPGVGRDKLCLDAMVDRDGIPFYTTLFTKQPHRLQGVFENALLTVYSRLPIGALSDPTSIKSTLKDKILQKPQSNRLVFNFFTKCLDVADLKLCCACSYNSSGGEVSLTAWKVILDRLNEGTEAVKGEEVWGILTAAELEYPWRDLVKFIDSKRGEKGDTIAVEFETVYGILVRKDSAAFSRFLGVLFKDGLGIREFLDILASYPVLVDKPNGEGWTTEFTNVVFPVVKAVKSIYTFKDDTTNRTRWNKAVETTVRERFQKLFYETGVPILQEMVSIYKHILDAFMTNEGKKGECAEYFELGLDFGVIKWDEKVLGLLDDELLSAAQFSLFEAAYRISQGTDMMWFHERVQKMIYALTVRLSQGVDGVLDICEIFGEFLARNEVDLMDYVAKDAVDSLLEVLVEKVSVGGGIVTLAAGIIGGVEDAKYLQHSKLLQAVLSSQTALSVTSYDAEKEKERYQLAYIIRKLFFAVKSAHSTVTTLDGVLALYGGSNDAIDAVLLEILISMEGSMGQSILERITALEVSEDGERFAERDGKARGVAIRLSERRVARSVERFFGKKVGFEGCEGLKEFMGRCEKLGDGEERNGTYDVGFLGALVMQGLSGGGKEETKLDVKDVVEKGLLGSSITALSSENAEERAMAEAVLVSTISKLEGSTDGKSRGYKERIEVLHLLCKISAGLAVFDGGNGVREQGIPTITAVILAKMVNIVANPGHWLYEKVMTWLLSRGNVDLAEVPMVKEFLRSEGEAYWKEVLWGVEGLAAGMKAVADVEICRKRGVFEEVLGMYTSISSTSSQGGKGKEEAVRKKIVEIVWNAAGVDGGATTLITRTGVISWIKMMLATVTDEEERVMLKRLAARLWEACDKDYVGQWSEGNIGRVLESLVRL
ncbi:hypothetical protein TWF694_001334 [Orbilia ellipsospora]|uniref:Uncharacterized protein n=1 Tax=Orbilia ellipsospora TaxID=2528407 RepID=A0AAV9XR95_9PEZI